MVAISSSAAETKKLPRRVQAPSGVAERAHFQLQSSPYAWLHTVSCACRGDVLILRGAVPSYYLKQLAQERVVHLAGVSRIENQIEVKRPR